MKTRHLVGLLCVGGLVASLAVGCSSDPGEETGTGGGGTTTTTFPMTTTPSTPTTSSGGTTSTTSSSGAPDESTSCADAVALEEFDNMAGGKTWGGDGIVNPAKDADFFTFEATEGAWYWLQTVANADDDPAMIDTVITLFNGDGTQKIAEVDDSFPRASTDSELFIRIPATGKYCIKVWEFSDWANQEPIEGDPTFAYEVMAVPIDTQIYTGFNEDAGSNDTTGTAQVLTFNTGDSGMIGGNFFGLLETGTDVDTVTLNVYFTPWGPEGFGSTGGPGVVNLLAADGTTVVAQLDYQQGSDGISQVPVSANTDYFVEVKRPNANVGANDFYFFKFFTGDATGQNPQETNDAANSAHTAAEVATAGMSNNPATTLHFLGGTIPAGDTDWWTVPSAFPAGSEVVVACSSWRAGSGVGDMTVELFEDPAGSADVTDTELETVDLLWSNNSSPNSTPTKNAWALKAQGTPYLKISSTKANASGATSTHYLCGFHLTTP